MASTPPLPIHCTATGAKLVAPMTAEGICHRFIAAFARAQGAPASASTSKPANGLTVELRFLPQGVAMASVTPIKAGTPRPVQRFEMAVSDRAFTPADIDRLAVDAAAGLRPTSRRQRR